jgi:hypothetical protein
VHDRYQAGFFSAVDNLLSLFVQSALFSVCDFFSHRKCILMMKIYQQKISLFNIFSYFIPQVKVTVMDKNDESPTFRDMPLSYTVSEDLGIGQIVATIKATDPDTIGKLEYSLISGDDGKFALDKHNGTLMLRDTLDRETKDLYKLLIRVTDGLQYTETTISIQVGKFTTFCL